MLRTLDHRSAYARTEYCGTWGKLVAAVAAGVPAAVHHSHHSRDSPDLRLLVQPCRFAPHHLIQSPHDTGGPFLRGAKQVKGNRVN